MNYKKAWRALELQVERAPIMANLEEVLSDSESEPNSTPISIPDDLTAAPSS
jgi:hypothetical protein